MEFIKTLPGAANYELFESMPKTIYPEQSPRWILGHDPVQTHLTACYVLMDQDKAVGRFSFYENPNLKHEGKATACIGSYECIEDTKVSSILLEKAIEVAKASGYSWLIGPMEGSTWENHRFSQSNEHPNYFMEPYHHEYYSAHFESFGFSKISSYYTSIVQPVNAGKEKLDASEQKYIAAGLTFRSINMSKLEEDLEKIAVFSNKAFKENFLFSPMDSKNFVSKYHKLSDYFDPSLIILVEDTNQKLKGIVFATKDYLNQVKNNLIIKTLARIDDPKYKGLGIYLVEKINQIAIQKGFDKLMYALMKDDGHSESIDNTHNGRQYKNYNLYGLQL